MKKIILIKFGGSLITEKDKPYTAKYNVIKALAGDMKKIIATQNDTLFLLGNGAGSFGHYPAQMYNIKEGIKTKEQELGYATIQDGVARLNRIVVEALLEQKIAASSLHPSSFLTASGGNKKTIFTDSLFGLLQLGIIPVIYGDIVYDETKGCYIFSTEDLFSLLIPALDEHTYHVEKIIQMTTVPGVLDSNNNIIPSITTKNIEAVKKHIYKTEGFDVTGGMLHKIETALLYARKGITTYILQGNTTDRLLIKAILSDTVRGTIIRSE